MTRILWLPREFATRSGSSGDALVEVNIGPEKAIRQRLTGKSLSESGSVLSSRLRVLQGCVRTRTTETIRARETVTAQDQDGKLYDASWPGEIVC